MNILLVSPYHGGSHEAWANGYAKSSQNQVQLLTLPDRFWKWRMHGGAVTLAHQFKASNWRPDVIMATDMLDLTTFLALTRHRTATVPALLYMHENQLTYPLPKEGHSGPMRRQLGERDQHYAFINFASMLAATKICFNSQFHLNSFFEALIPFLKHYPEYNELGSIDLLKVKSQVLPVGIQFDDSTSQDDGLNDQDDSTLSSSLLILWNQRWEYDKNPELFFETLFRLSEVGYPFRLAVCGQQLGKRPLIFQQAHEKLKAHIIHFGFAEKETYQHLLRQADIVVSTAVHEFFGISILEAIGHGTFPLLPNRLSYPELLPKEVHDISLYNSKEALLEKLIWAIENKKKIKTLQKKMSKFARLYRWQTIAADYDALFASLII